MRARRRRNPGWFRWWYVPAAVGVAYLVNPTWVAMLALAVRDKLGISTGTTGTTVVVRKAAEQ